MDSPSHDSSSRSRSSDSHRDASGRAALANNPLLVATPLPLFDRIEAEHVVPAMEAVLAELETETQKIEETGQPSWEGVVEPLERIYNRIGQTWGTVSHLMGVANSEALREAHATIQPKLVEFSSRLGQSRKIYELLCALDEKHRDASDRFRLDSTQERILESMLKSAVHSGVGLEGEARRRFNEIATELARLTTEFSNNVLDATRSYELVLTDSSEIDGLPRTALESAAESARKAGHPTATAEKGPWRFTLDYPSYLPFIEHCRRRDLREQIFRASLGRASSGEFDNSEYVIQILRLRHEKAKLLGFDTYAELSLDRKMAPSVAEIDRLVAELKSKSHPAARADMDELREFARSQGAAEADELRHWDLPFWSQRLRESRFAYTEEELRPYFSLPRVLDGLFSIARRLFGLGFVDATGETPVWNEDVRYFKVLDEAGEPIASFYLDPFSRPHEKRGGAWMDECVGRSNLFPSEERPVRLPVAYLVCNQTPPVGDRPSLMSFNEVLTLFHEFGHGLQHMLTRVDYGLAAGIRNVEWDAIELPSQFMENWCYHPPMLRELSGHWETGEPLPEKYVEKILASRNYRAGSGMLRQLYIGAVDMELHHRFDPTDADVDAPFERMREILREYSILEPLPEDRFLNSFTHVFAGGYAAGYYSYKWAEVLSADAFAAFEEAGLDDEGQLRDTGRRFRDTVLARGGSQHPMEVFREFRGRNPSTAALLRHCGL